MNGWLRPFKRDYWHLVPYWRRIHRLMSTQALGLGSAFLTVEIAIGAPKWVLLLTLGLTAAAVLAGALIEQPEISDE
jgi:hypothetical protein